MIQNYLSIFIYGVRSHKNYDYLVVMYIDASTNQAHIVTSQYLQATSSNWYNDVIMTDRYIYFYVNGIYFHASGRQLMQLDLCTNLLAACTLPINVSKMSTTSINKKILIMDQTQYYLHDLDDVHNEKLKSMHYPRTHATCIGYKDRFYVIGGIDSRSIDRGNGIDRGSRCEYYDLTTNKWVICANMLTGRVGSVAVIWKHHYIAVMGGRNYLTLSESVVELYHISSNTWIRSSWNLPEPMENFYAHVNDYDQQLILVHRNNYWILSHDEKWTRYHLPSMNISK